MRQLFTATSTVASWPNELNQWPIRTQCTIAWLSVIILLRFAHVIFIEINVDKIINAFTKNFFVNVVNVYHIYGGGQLPSSWLSQWRSEDFSLRRYKYHLSPNFPWMKSSSILPTDPIQNYCRNWLYNLASTLNFKTQYKRLLCVNLYSPFIN